MACLEADLVIALSQVFFDAYQHVKAILGKMQNSIRIKSFHFVTE